MLRLNWSTNLLDRTDNVRIRATAADVPAHGFLYIFVAVTVRLVKERDSRHDLTRCAVPTLEAVMFDECGLHRMQISRLTYAFNRRDCLTLKGGCKA